MYVLFSKIRPLTFISEFLWNTCYSLTSFFDIFAKKSIMTTKGMSLLHQSLSWSTELFILHITLFKWQYIASFRAYVVTILKTLISTCLSLHKCEWSLFWKLQCFRVSLWINWCYLCWGNFEETAHYLEKYSVRVLLRHIKCFS